MFIGCFFDYFPSLLALVFMNSNWLGVKIRKKWWEGRNEIKKPFPSVCAKRGVGDAMSLHAYHTIKTSIEDNAITIIKC